MPTWTVALWRASLEAVKDRVESVAPFEKHEMI
jgi:hypothetical protein